MVRKIAVGGVVILIGLFIIGFMAAPPSDSDVDTGTVSMTLAECVDHIDETASNLGTVPIDIVDTDEMKMVRFRTTDGSVVVTCQGGLMGVTKSTYQG